MEFSLVQSYASVYRNLIDVHVARHGKSDGLRFARVKLGPVLKHLSEDDRQQLVGAFELVEYEAGVLGLATRAR